MITMIAESISILAITLCMMFIFLRAKRPDYAVSLVPLLMVPAAHLLAMPLVSGLRELVPGLPYRLGVSFVDIAALAVSCGLIILFSAKIKSKKNKRLYTVLLMSYNIILACVYLYRTLGPLLFAD